MSSHLVVRSGTGPCSCTWQEVSRSLLCMIKCSWRRLLPFPHAWRVCCAAHPVQVLRVRGLQLQVLNRNGKEPLPKVPHSSSQALPTHLAPVQVLRMCRPQRLVQACHGKRQQP